MDIHQLFTMNVRIGSCSPMDADAIWPHNVEIVITRVPIRNCDGYNRTFIDAFATKLKEHMVTNGIVFLVCYAPSEDKSRPFEVARAMSDAGFHHIDNIVIHKSWYPGKKSEISLVNSHEYVMFFCNGNVWRLDRLPIREYLKTPDTQSCPGNTWNINVGSLDEAIPIDLANLLLQMVDTLPGSIVFDPFMGNQSTLKSALKMGHSFYGFEVKDRHMNRYRKIIEEAQKGKI